MSAIGKGSDGVSDAIPERPCADAGPYPRSPDAPYSDGKEDI
jgi:hypothetical protein